VRQARSYIEQGADAGWQEGRFENNDETATLYGVEISWQQWLNFLPGVLSNLSVYGNYAWISSTYNVDFREDEVALPGQSPHVVNAALTYDQGRFSTQVSYHWTSESLSLIGQDQFLPPSADTNTPIYRDRYVDSWSDVSFSFRFRIAEQFRFWADVYNLLNRERIAYEYDRVLYPVETEWIGGRTFQAGIRFDL